MTESVVTAPPDCPVRAVAEMMRERNVGSVGLVGDDGLPVGFVTDRDLALSVLADGRDAQEPAEGHATAPVVTGEPGMGVEAAADLMVSHGIRRLPVLDGDRLIGIVTLDDLAVRTGDLALALRITAEITRAALPARRPPRGAPGFLLPGRGGGVAPAGGGPMTVSRGPLVLCARCGTGVT